MALYMIFFFLLFITAVDRIDRIRTETAVIHCEQNQPQTFTLAVAAVSV